MRKVVYQRELEFPPIKFVKRPKTSRGKVQTVYANMNTLNSDKLHFGTRTWLMQESVKWWMQRISDAPRLEAMQLHLRFKIQSNLNWDLDNKGSFWLKALLDALKPSKDAVIRQGPNKGKTRKDIPRLGVIPDDTVKYIHGYSVDAVVGDPSCIVTLYEALPLDGVRSLFPIGEADDLPF